MKPTETPLYVTQGDAASIPIEVLHSEDDEAQDIGAVTFRLQARLRAIDTGAPVLELTSGGGGVVIVDAPNGVAELRFAPADTAELAAPGESLTLVYDLEAIGSAGPETIMHGPLHIRGGIAR